MPLSYCLVLLVLAGAIVSSPVAAARYTDATYGLSVEIPDGYAVKRVQKAEQVKLILTRGETYCLIDYQPARPPFDTQAAVNAFVKPVLTDLFRKDPRRGPITTFVIGDVEGVAAESTFERSGGSKRRDLVVMLETTKGHAHFSCADAIRTYDTSRPTFERLFHSVHLP